MIRRINGFACVLATAALMLSACGGMPSITGGKSWKSTDLSVALANQSRAQADRDRDADRKPADFMVFLGVRQGMTALDLLAAGGYMTEVLSVAVGPKGKVYAENPPQLLKMRDGANDKALSTRLASNRLPNVTRVDESLPTPAIAENSVDVAVTAMNLHDIYNAYGAAQAEAFMKSVFAVLKPGGVFGVIDHVGNDGADNAKLHRMPKHQALEVAKAAGFVVEEESNMLARAADDHTKLVFDASLRGKTDQFVLKLRKPKS
jgi:predicted methyltransferase